MRADLYLTIIVLSPSTQLHGLMSLIKIIERTIKENKMWQNQGIYGTLEEIKQAN